MTDTIRREIVFSRSPEEVWQALTESATLAEWMYPNDFKPEAGHRFSFRTPANPRAGFDGLIHCEVLECSPPERLVYTWDAGPVAGTRVTYRLVPEGAGTRLIFEHSGFDVSQPWSKDALSGAELGWTKMLDGLSKLVDSPAGHG